MMLNSSTKINHFWKYTFFFSLKNKPTPSRRFVGGIQYFSQMKHMNGKKEKKYGR